MERNDIKPDGITIELDKELYSNKKKQKKYDTLIQQTFKRALVLDSPWATIRGGFHSNGGDEKEHATVDFGTGKQGVSSRTMFTCQTMTTPKFNKPIC